MTVKIEVGARIEVAREGLPEAAVERLKDLFTHANPERKRWEARGKRGKAPEEHVRTWRMASVPEPFQRLSLPRGGWDRVERVLKGEFGLSYVVEDVREKVGASHIFKRNRGNGFDDLALSVEPYDYQERMISAVLESEQGVLRGPTGCGKTVVLEAIALRLGVQACVLVPTGKIFDDWLDRLPREIGIAPADIGVIRGGKERIRPITVALVQSYAKRAERYAGMFGLLAFDEVWRAAAKTFYRAVDTSRARYRVGMSADERRKDRKEFLIYDLFGELLVDISRRDLIEQGRILDTEVRLVPTAFDAPWYREIDRQRRAAGEGYDRLLREMSRDRERNRLVVDLALEEILSGKQVLCFSHLVEHCATLRAEMAPEFSRLFPSGGRSAGLVVGDGNGYDAESAATLAGMRDGSVDFAAGTYQSIGAGVNLPAVEVGIAATPVHSNRAFFGQVRGRVCRTSAGKETSVLYVPWDRAVHGLSPLRAMVRWNKTVRVLDAGRWRDGREVLRELEAAEDDVVASTERGMVGTR